MSKTLKLNGLHIAKKQTKFFIDEIYDDVLRKKFQAYRIKVGDEVIVINNIYCEHLRTVTKYVETNCIKNMRLKCKYSGLYYSEEEHIQLTEIINLGSTYAATNENGKLCKTKNILIQFFLLTNSRDKRPRFRTYMG